MHNTYVGNDSLMHIKKLLMVGLCSLCVVACDNAQRIEHSRVSDQAYFGSDVDMTLRFAVVGAEQDNGGEGSVYVYSFGRGVWSIHQRLESPAPAAEQFGASVSTSGSFIAVGAPLADHPGAIDSGSVYIYRLSGNDWNHVQTISSAGGNEASEGFGRSIALDGTRLLVGAPSRDQVGANDAGAAFVYSWNGAAFMLDDTLAAPTPVADDHFGASVDVDASTIVVGTTGHDTVMNPDVGAVHVFESNGVSYVFDQTLIANDDATDDAFGSSVSLFAYNSGDRRMVIGAPGFDQHTGAAYVFDAPVAAGFIQTTKLLASDGSGDDNFGEDVSLWDESIIVGASGEDSVTVNGGAAYAFSLQGVWIENDKLTITNAESDDFLGGAVSHIGEQALLGVTGADGVKPTTTNSGKVEAFTLQNGNVWQKSHTLTAAGRENFDGFGSKLAKHDTSVLISGSSHADLLAEDLDAFSLARVFEAQPDSSITAVAFEGSTAATFGRRTNPALPIGYIEVFIEQGGVWSQQDLIDPDLVSISFPLESANSPRMVLQGDTLVLGARRWNLGDGRVFVYTRNGSAWTQSQLFTSAVAGSNFDRNFGNHVALDGEWLAIAEVPSSGVPGSDRFGTVHVYERINGSFVAQQELTDPIPATLDNYGRGLAMSGDLLAVYGTANSTLRVYRRNAGVYSSVWSQVVTDIGSGDIGLSLTSDLLAIGAPLSDYDGLSDAGEVRIFERQVDDSYIAGQVYRPSDAESNLQLGKEVVVDGDRVFASSLVNGRVYIIDL